ncbi:MAG: LPXTG cell wall anchor domain-containing protein [Actinobacteria bacterium]|nr:LPXTG cell wall anchor domain-containing protein [Actinomycetota bacterium]
MVAPSVLGSTQTRGSAAANNLAATGTSSGATFAAGMVLVAVGAVLVRRSTKLA